MRRIEFRYCKRTLNEVMLLPLMVFVGLGVVWGVLLFLILSDVLSFTKVMPIWGPIFAVVLLSQIIYGFNAFFKWPKWGEARGYIDLEPDRAVLHYGKRTIEIVRNQVCIETERMYFDLLGILPVLTKYKFKVNGKKYHILESMLEAKERTTTLERRNHTSVRLSLREALVQIFPLFVYNPVAADFFAMSCRGVRLIYGISTVEVFNGSPFVPDLIGAELVENSPYIRCYLRNRENMSHIVAVLSLQKAEGETVKPSIEELRQRPILGVTETNMQG